MTFQIVDHMGQVLGEYDDYAEASERVNNLNDQFGPYAQLRHVPDPAPPRGRSRES